MTSTPQNSVSPWPLLQFLLELLCSFHDGASPERQKLKLAFSSTIAFCQVASSLQQKSKLRHVYKQS